MVLKHWRYFVTVLPEYIKLSTPNIDYSLSLSLCPCSCCRDEKIRFWGMDWSQKKKAIICKSRSQGLRRIFVVKRSLCFTLSFKAKKTIKRLFCDVDCFLERYNIKVWRVVHLVTMSIDFEGFVFSVSVISFKWVIQKRSQGSWHFQRLSPLLILSGCVFILRNFLLYTIPPSILMFVVCDEPWMCFIRPCFPCVKFVLQYFL